MPDKDFQKSAEKKLRPMDSAPAVDPVITSEELFKGRTLVLIQHHDETYRLQITKNGKLLLYK